MAFESDDTKSETLTKIQALDTSNATKAAASDLTTHTGNTSNPHSVTKTQVGLGSVENTAISTWTGTTNVTTLGTIATGVWSGTTISTAKGGLGADNSAASGVPLFASGTVTITATSGTGNFARVSITDGHDTRIGTLEDYLDGTTPVAEMDVTLLNVENFSVSRTLGTDDTYKGYTLSGINAGATIAQWELVYYSFSDGEWMLADANGSSTYPAAGIATGASTNGNPLTVMTTGFVRNDAWSWSAGPIYLSATPGGLTQTAPSTSGDKVQPIGYAITADVAYFHFNQTFVEVA